jgi:SAM-dependent methyltransferase
MMSETMPDPAGYLKRLAAPLQAKLESLTKYFPPSPSPEADALQVLDVGCADGALTVALAQWLSHSHVLGLDVNAAFIDQAVAKAAAAGLQAPTVRFQNRYLRELLVTDYERFDVIVFASVLHEFYSYGSGIASVVKALGDATELLKPTGRIIIRDMIPLDKRSGPLSARLRDKVLRKANPRQLADFIACHGPIETINSLNHFLLKYFYYENWERECRENYLAVSSAEYLRLFELLGLRVTFQWRTLLPWLRQKWVEDFGLTYYDCHRLFSTTIIVAEKPQ